MLDPTTPFERLDLPVRCWSTLRQDYPTRGHLMTATDRELLAYPNIGRGTIEHIRREAPRRREPIEQPPQEVSYQMNRIEAKLDRLLALWSMAFDPLEPVWEDEHHGEKATAET